VGGGQDGGQGGHAVPAAAGAGDVSSGAGAGVTVFGFDGVDLGDAVVDVGAEFAGGVSSRGRQDVLFDGPGDRGGRLVQCGDDGRGFAVVDLSVFEGGGGVSEGASHPTSDADQGGGLVTGDPEPEGDFLAGGVHATASVVRAAALAGVVPGGVIEESGRA